jgi:excisionase family DNA binding protein
MVIELLVDGQPCVGVGQAAARLGVTRGRVYQWIGDGRLPSVDGDGRRFIRLADLARPPKRTPGRKPPTRSE